MSSATTSAVKPIRGTHIPNLVPPEVFGHVEPGIYRSNAPHPGHFEHLKTLNLKTVLYLSPEIPVRAVKAFYEEHGIEMIHLGLKTWKPDIAWKPMGEELYKEALEIVLDAAKHPILVVCTSGLHQTGTLIGCLRRIQGWCVTSILEEYRSFAGVKSRYANEQFIETFDVDLVSVPTNAPSWLQLHLKLLEEEREEYAKMMTDFVKNNADRVQVSPSGQLQPKPEEQTETTIAPSASISRAESPAPSLVVLARPSVDIPSALKSQRPRSTLASPVRSASPLLNSPTSASQQQTLSSRPLRELVARSLPMTEQSKQRIQAARQPVYVPSPRDYVLMPPADLDEDLRPAYKIFYYHKDGPLCSKRAVFSEKSLIDDDDD